MKQAFSKSILVQQMHHGYVLLIIASIVLLVAFGGHTVTDFFKYQRESVLNGQLWRMFTAPLVHLTWSHALMNLAGLFIIWGLFAQTLSNRAWLILTFCCTLVISAGLLLLQPEVYWYVGLSGLLHSYFSAGAIADRHMHRFTSILMLILLAGKLSWEQTLGPLPGSAETAGGKVITEAHLYGAISGLIVGWLLSLKSPR